MENCNSQNRKQCLDWWHYLLFLAVLFQLCFYIIPQFRPGLLGVICWYFGMDLILWGAVAILILFCGIIWAAFHRPFWNRWRIGGYLLLISLLVSTQAFRVYPSSFDNRPSPVHFQLPLDGPITVAWGGATPDVNYHVMVPDQRWAYDLVVTKDGKTHKGKGSNCVDYYCYGMPILAPANGVVHSFFDGDPDVPIGVWGGGTNPGGNHVVLEVAPEQFLFICHMQPGSITVKSGESVVAGQMIGRVGNSGNTSEPHIHIHLQNGSFPFLAEGIPLYFYHYCIGEKIVDRGIPTGGINKGQWAGQIIEQSVKEIR